jgi:uncharacterized membrane protein YcfT
MTTSAALKEGRVDWVDYAKGFCICFVVMMHSTLGVEAAAGHEGWMHHLVAFAKPFRMPDFFMISGLFLARVIDRNWRDYLDRKVVHFAYFYALWVTIQFAFKAPGLVGEHGLVGVAGLYLFSYIEPFGTLWFIYLLPIFLVVTKLTRNVPPLVIWAIAAALEILRAHGTGPVIDTGWTAIDEFASRFVYFYTGYILAPYIFRLAAGVQAKMALGAAGLLVWGVVNYTIVATGWSEMPFVSLALGIVGAGAVVTISALLARFHVFKPLRHCGQNSIVVYLAFFLPMAVSRAVLLKTGIITDIGTISVLVTATGVVVPLILHLMVRNTSLRFLFERPEMFKLKPARKTEPRLTLQPAE